jgi:hypothetical protein
MHNHALLPQPALPPPLRAYPSKLFVETTTRCNLGCFMCVKQTQQCGIAEGDLSPAIFEKLEPAFPHLEELVLNGIGEPIINLRLEGLSIRPRDSCLQTDGSLSVQQHHAPTSVPFPWSRQSRLPADAASRKRSKVQGRVRLPT